LLIGVFSPFLGYED